MPTATPSSGRDQTDPSEGGAVLNALRHPRVLGREVTAGFMTSMALSPESTAFAVVAGLDPRMGLYGAVIVAGLFALLAAPLVGRLLPLFPPVVTGTVILVIGISLMRVGVNWAAGGLGNPRYGALLYLGLSLPLAFTGAGRLSVDSLRTAAKKCGQLRATGEPCGR